jgi:hypothetical protein
MLTTRCRTLVVVSAFALTAFPSFARAQTTADDKEVASYRLTMAGLNRMARINSDLAAELSKDPKYQELMNVQAQVRALEAKDSLTDAEQKQLDDLNARAEKMTDDQPGNDLMGDARTIDEMAAKIKMFAPLSSALSKEGMSPREYSVFTMALLQAAMAASMQKAGALKQLPAGVNAENVKFVLDHEADIRKLQQSFGGSDK